MIGALIAHGSIGICWAELQPMLALLGPVLILVVDWIRRLSGRAL